MMDRLLKTHLEPIAQAHRRSNFLRSLALGWLAASTGGLLLLLVQRSAGTRSSWPFLLTLLAALAWPLASWWRRRHSPIDYLSVARKLEQENPHLRAVLLTAAEQKPGETEGELNYLQKRVIRQALGQDREDAWCALALTRLRYAQLGAAGTLSLLVFVLAGLYHVAPPRLAGLGFSRSELTITPGDASIEKGMSLVVMARFAGEAPAEATLTVRPANEPERRVPLTKNLDDPVFGASLPAVKNDLIYRVEYGAERTRDFKVTVFEYPRLERADATVTYPAYTRLPEKNIQDTRRVSAVEGSSVDYTFHLNKAVRSALLVGKDNPRIPLVQDTNSASVYSARFTLDKSGRYDLFLLDDAGRTNKQPAQFVFSALTNRAPDLKFISPRGDQRVSALEEISFKGEASDDFGLQAYGFAYNLAGQDTKIVELGKPSGPNEKRVFDYVVKLEDLGAQVDQLLSYYLWADDVGPGGQVRRTESDMFFAEVRPFEELFREGQAQDSSSAQQQGQQEGQNAGERLAELQKQVIIATWNLKRGQTGRALASAFKNDVRTIKESQQDALQQTQARRQDIEDPRAGLSLASAEKQMKQAADLLARASDNNSVEPLSPALVSEQSAYQSLLRLAEREYQVSRSQRGQSGQNSRGARAQRQLQELELSQTQNRYETERQAAPAQNTQRREQLQAFSRLKELAQRQQDVNERLKELQSALQEAKSDAERQDIRDRLKRLQEEQQQMLADVDELRQRMDRPENQSDMSEARQQLDQTRAEVQRASDSMDRGQMPQALSSGTRAQRDLKQLSDEFRKQSSSQFADEVRQLRTQARALSQQEDSIGGKLEALNGSTAKKTLTDSDERKELARQLDEQKKQLEDLIKHGTELTDKAEPVEPLLARQLYDALRAASQSDTKDLQETAEDLLAQGKLNNVVYHELNEAKGDSKKAVEVAADLLREGFPVEANSLEQRARRSIKDLKTGVEHAAQSVLGDDAEALRLARAELADLAGQLDRELAQARRRAGTNDPGGSTGNSASQTGPRNGGDSESGNEAASLGQGEMANARNDVKSQQPGAESSQPNAAEQAGRSRQGGRTTNEMARVNPGRTGNDQIQGGPRQTGLRGGARENGGQFGGGARSFLDNLGGGENGAYLGGPITGAEYGPWSDRLRDVEEMLDFPDLRAQAAQIRDRARLARLDVKRHAAEPKWDLVQMQILRPLVELRDRVEEELLRRQSKDAIVPMDRDPVPTPYAELVRRYYEQLGKSESSAAASQAQ